MPGEKPPEEKPEGKKDPVKETEEFIRSLKLDPTTMLYLHNMPLPIDRVDKKLVLELDRDFQEIPHHWFRVLPGHADEEKLDRRLEMIRASASDCKWGIITVNVLYNMLESLARKISTKGLATGQFEEEGFQKLVLLAGEEHENGFGGPGEFNYMSKKFGREFAQALNAIPALWDYASYMIADFYGASKARCDIWGILHHPRIKKSQRNLREHIRFNGGKNPYERVSRLRNMDQHREDISEDVYKSVFGMADPQTFEKNEARVKQYVSDLGEGYRHFVKGYGIMIDQMKKDAREMKDREIFG